MRSLLRSLSPKSLLPRALFAAIALLGLSVVQPAQAKFSQSYNYPDLKWESIETEHFVVHYAVSKRTEEQGNAHYLTSEWSARKIAKVAEEMWAPMCEQLNYFLKEKIHIVLLNQTDSLEGFTVPEWDWIEVSANPGKMFARMRGRMEWFSDVMVHEFAHVVSLKQNDPFSEAMMGVSMGALYQDGINNVDSGVELFLGTGDSVFWTEGGAEYWSDNAGWNWWSASRDQFIRSTVLEGRLLTYDEWHTRAGKRGPGHWSDGERYYQQGYSFGQYLRQRFGEDTYARFAMEYGKAWRPEWETVIEDVVGVDAHTLYDDWVAYVTKKYDDQEKRIEDRGIVEGHEIAGFKFQPWETDNPQDREKWQTQANDKGHKKGRAKAKMLTEIAREKTGTYQYEPRISDDGKLWASLSYGVIGVTQATEDMFPQFTGVSAKDPDKLDEAGRMSVGVPANFEHGYDFVPGENALVITGDENSFRHAFSATTGIHGELDGYNWDQLYLVDLDKLTREKKVGNRRVETRTRKGLRGASAYHKAATAIPNTLRGNNPAVSPDGKRIAYLEYTDGVLNLVLINPDGTDKKHLTNWDDGTWFQGIDWSPDGKQLVVSMFRQYQQNLWLVDVDTGAMKPLMVDSWEEADPHWAHDGKIYFSADVDGVWNIFSVDPKNGDFLQITNEVAGAASPQITPEGNLVYSYAGAFGWKVYGLPKAAFFNRPANQYFTTDFDQAKVDKGLQTREDLSSYADQTSKYHWWKAKMAPFMVPILRLDSNSRTNWGLSAGFQFLISDYVEKNQLFLYTMLGEDPLHRRLLHLPGVVPEHHLLRPAHRGQVQPGLPAGPGQRSLHDQRPDHLGDPTGPGDRHGERGCVLPLVRSPEHQRLRDRAPIRFQEHRGQPLPALLPLSGHRCWPDLRQCGWV